MTIQKRIFQQSVLAFKLYSSLREDMRWRPSWISIKTIKFVGPEMETAYGFPYGVIVVFDFRSTAYRMSYSEQSNQEFILMIHYPVVDYVLSLFLIDDHYRAGIIR